MTQEELTAYLEDNDIRRVCASIVLYCMQTGLSAEDVARMFGVLRGTMPEELDSAESETFELVRERLANKGSASWQN